MAGMAQIFVIHGPNLNLLGQREPEVYGTTTLDTINKELTEQAQKLGHQLTHIQSNAEHELVDAIQRASKNKIDLILINPAAFTHTSVAIRDALLAVAIPCIEVHLSNPNARESFRHHSVISDVAVGTISGFGAYSYTLALNAGDYWLVKNKK